MGLLNVVVHKLSLVESQNASANLPSEATFYITSCGFGHELASFPGSRAWTEKTEPGTHCLCMLSSPRISGNFPKICSITLTSTRYADFYKIMPATDHILCRRWRGSNKGTQLFACRNCPHFWPFQLNAVACE